ncbi:DUF317 domain-containing protein [Streptomyces yangpuensis]|uniref:DUF317 domain-containing protein n=1 Tax=Streptomyces yangpuensis TaxID=1648182 RepID=UPI00381DDC0B
MLASPDQQALLHLEPEPDQPWWAIRHTRTASTPAWQASFGARTPAEIIAAFTDALTDPARPAASGSPYEPLRNAGWQPARDHSGLTSPDGIAHVEHFTETGSDTWFSDVAISGDPEGLIWRAQIGTGTPTHLVAAVTRALADPSPLRRDPQRLPRLGQDLMHTSVRQLPAAHVAFALERRIDALASRTPGPCRPAPPPPPAVQPRPPRSR